MNGVGNALFRNVAVDGDLTDVLVRDGLIHRIGTGLVAHLDAEVIEGDGGALIPGLHDHHVHLAALAAAMHSVEVGPPYVTTIEQFARVLSDADERLPAGTWIRAVGYHESVAGRLDRSILDRVVASRPVRVQDRSGKRWTLNSSGLERTAASSASHPGIERDMSGRPTGLLDRADEWLGRAVGNDFPDLMAVGRNLADLGVTGVTDCTPYGDTSGPSAIALAASTGLIPQAVYLTGSIDLAEETFDSPLLTGPVKIVLDEERLPPLTDLVGCVQEAHRAGRCVAMHIVTAATLAFSLAAWKDAGVRRGDRIEHGSVITEGAAERVAELGLTVVTQPGFVAERGDRYLVDVDDDEIPHLYRCASLLAMGIPVAAGSDVPYTDPDPWLAIRAAMDRRTPSGEVLGPHERLSLDHALALFTGHPLDPGRSQRRVVVGSPADLCLLTRPLHGKPDAPTAEDVRSAYRAGVRI